MDADIRHEIQAEVNNAVKNTQDQLLNSLTTLLDSRLEGFQKNIQDNQKSLSETQIAKIDETMSDPYKFRKRGNDEQFKHNQKVFVKVREASNQLETAGLTQENISVAKRKISEGMDIIKHRQKLIKLADSSDAGWRVVDEYETNPLAEDSDDEKKIYKAQSRAESKLKKEKTKKADTRSTPYSYKRPVVVGNQIPVTNSNSSVFRPGRCFFCNERGHWRRDCPKMLAEQKSNMTKISIDKFSQILSVVQESNTPLFTIDKARDKQSVSNTHTIDRNVIHKSTGVGHLRENVNKWREIGANNVVVDVIENGYKIPFLTLPNKVELDNNKSARDNKEFVTTEIDALLKKGCISRVENKPHVINPLTVANNGTKLRLVLDARHINPHLFKFKHKYEDANTARQLFEKGNYIFSYDLKSAYHHITIFQTDKTYLGFSWLGRYYVYDVLPFGLATSGYIFSKVVREVVKYWRGKGLKIVMYLDDGLGGADSFQETLKASNVIKTDLESFGFTIAHEKCNWYPVQTLEWLGFLWDVSKGVLRITDKRIAKLKSSLMVLKQNYFQGTVLFRVRFIAGIVGQIISTQAVLGENSRLRTRYLYRCILARASWDSKIEVNRDAIGECIYWLENVDHLNEIGSQLCQLTYNEPQDIYMFCDASDRGFGGHLTAGSEDEPVEMFGSWSREEQVQSSTWRELEAVRRLIIHFCSMIKGIRLDDFVDEAVQDSGIDVDSSLYKLYPKMCELLISSKSDNTVKSYFYAFKRWERFINLHGFIALPAQPVHVALYLTSLLNNGSTCHPVHNAVYGIKWAHEINGLVDPTTNSFVESIVEASKRTTPKKIEKKEPISVETLIELCNMFKDSNDLLIIRDITMMLLSFAGFLRYDEVSSLRFCDIEVRENFLVLHINKSKTDQYRQSSEILICKGSTLACPYTMYLKYIHLVDSSTDSTEFLFRPIYRSGSTCKLISKNKKLSYTAARQALLKRIKVVVPDCNIGLHSFRAGGATAAANADVSTYYHVRRAVGKFTFAF